MPIVYINASITGQKHNQSPKQTVEKINEPKQKKKETAKRLKKQMKKELAVNYLLTMVTHHN